MKNKDERFFNYAKTCRKRSGLSQNEVAYLFGHGSSHFVRQTELGNELNILSRVLSYQILFGRQTEEIFADLYKALERQIFTRLSALSATLDGQKQSDDVKRKISFLDSVAARIATNNKDV